MSLDLIFCPLNVVLYGAIAFGRPQGNPWRAIYAALCVWAAIGAAIEATVAILGGSVTVEAVLRAAYAGWMGWCAWRIWTKGKPPRNRREVEASSKVKVRAGQLVVVPAGGAS